MAATRNRRFLVPVPRARALIAWRAVWNVVFSPMPPAPTNTLMSSPSPMSRSPLHHRPAACARHLDRGTRRAISVPEEATRTTHATHASHASQDPLLSRSQMAKIGAGESFQSVDEPFSSPELARAALLAEVSGARSARSPELADRLVRAARRGLDEYHRDRAAHEYFAYLKKVESAVSGLPAPRFSKPEFPPESPPSDLWKTREEMESSARHYHELVTGMIKAKLRVLEKFGELAVAKTFEKPRERIKFYMTLAMLRDSHDAAYDAPTPAELALVAVVHGVDTPMRSPHDQDHSEKRRKRWQYTLSEAKALFDQELGIVPRSSGA
jgi:hypothetical protein